jgi:DNA-binding beta-propeller fold protein YncE
MQTMRRSVFLVLTFWILVASLSTQAQVVTATVASDVFPGSIGVNSVTNKVYVANNCGTDPNCQSAGTVTVIDGATLGTQRVATGYYPLGVAVNSVTNKIYVANCNTDPSCSTQGAITVINGATLATQTVVVGVDPNAVAVNSVTNKIYALNLGCSSIPCNVQGTVTVIDGNTLATQTVNVGYTPYSLTVDSTHNKIYVPNVCGSTGNCGAFGNVTVIDGVTLGTQTVDVQETPLHIAVNETTNKIYVVNNCGGDTTCQSNGSVSVIDGSSLQTTTVEIGYYPSPVAVNPTTNKVYVSDQCSAAIPQCYTTQPSVAIIDGSTLATSYVTICSVDTYPSDVQVNRTTNQVYLPCAGRPDGLGYSTGLSVAVLNGTTNVVTPVAVGDYPLSAGINPTTNTAYVPNVGDNTVSVIGGATTLQFVNVVPCRLVDTRSQGGPIPGNSSRDFAVPQLGGCNIPTTAVSYSLNVTVVPQGPLGYLTIWPTSQDQPSVSTMNSPDGRTKANAAIVQGGLAGSVSVYVHDTTNVILDIDGYFAPSSGSTLQFFALTPCRVVDTRGADGSLGGPHLTGGQERDFPVLSSDCQIPSSAKAYSMNFTVVPVSGPLGYLTVWPTGETQPVVSTLNNPTATEVANAAIVPAGNGGAISVYASQDTQMIADIDGYFAPAAAGGMSLYPTAPCRVLDTRSGAGAFMGELTVNVVGSPCVPPIAAQAYVFNATVIPSGRLGYLSLWPDGENQPVVSTLNAIDGLITSNMAIVPTNNGQVDAYASALTQLIMDISSYFAP